MEELLKQAREFEQSFWGGLFYFLGGALFVYSSFWPGQNWRLWLSLMGLIAAACWTVVLFMLGRILLGGLLALIVLAGVARTIATEIQRRRQRA
jgi:1,4-dihydroxy-2-naphthoate octaprenyltransferase